MVSRMQKIPFIKVKKVMCSYCNHIWLRQRETLPSGCPKCRRRFVGKQPIILAEAEI